MAYTGIKDDRLLVLVLRVAILRGQPLAASATEVAPEGVVNVVASADGDDEDQQLAVVDLIADSVVAYPDAPDPGIAFERLAAMRPRGLGKVFDGDFDRLGIGRLLSAQLVQKRVRASKDFNRIGHSGGLSAGTSNERHALLVAAAQFGKGVAHRLFVNEVFQLLEQLGGGGGHHGRRTTSVLGQIRRFAAVLGTRRHCTKISSRLAYGHFFSHVQNVL